jgi:hypothetical protein
LIAFVRLFGELFLRLSQNRFNPNQKQHMDGGVRLMAGWSGRKRDDVYRLLE